MYIKITNTAQRFGKPLAFFLSIFLLCSFMHPAHLSIANMEFDEETSEFQVSVNLFKDDLLELFLAKKYIETVQEGVQGLTQEKHLALITDYIRENFIIRLSENMPPVELTFFEQTKFDDESVWVYFGFSLKNDKTNAFEVQNTLLFDLFDDQTNLLIINHPRVQNGYRFDILNTKVQVKMSGN